MGGFLKQSTASQARLLGPFVDDTDGTAAETGLTIANTDIRISKNGANIVSKNSGGATHDELGYYTATFDATDTNTVGHLKVMVKMSGALVVEDEFWVLEEDIYEALFASGAAAFNSSDQVAVGSVAANAITAAAIADAAIDSATFAADVGIKSIRSNTATGGGASSVTLDASASSVTDFYKGALVRLTGGTGAGQVRLITAYNGTSKVATVASAWATQPVNGTTFAIIPFGPANVVAILGELVSTSTAQLGVNIVSAAGTAWASGAITAASIASNAITSAKIAASAIGATQIASSAITAAKFAADAITSTVIADGALTAAKFAAGAFDAVWSVTTRLLTAGTNIVLAKGVGVTGFNDPAAADNADAVWDEVRSGHATQGTYGELFNAERSGTVNDANTTPSATEFAASDITEATDDHFVGRLIIFTTGALAYQATRITGYTLTSGEGVFTVEQMTEAPADSDQFIVV